MRIELVPGIDALDTVHTFDTASFFIGQAVYECPRTEVIRCGCSKSDQDHVIGELFSGHLLGDRHKRTDTAGVILDTVIKRILKSL